MFLRKIINLFFFIGVFLIPFNSVEVYPILGEYRYESSILFFLIAFALILIYYVSIGKIIFPYKNKIYLIFVAFVMWCLVSFLFNFFEIRLYYFKQTSGILRFIKQFIALLIAGLICFNVFWFTLKDKSPKEILLYIRKVFSYTLTFVSIYGFIELLISYFNLRFLIPLYDLFSYLPYIESRLHNGGRISSVALEPPFLAIYLITISGWMFSYIITNKSIFKFLPSIALLLLAFFSGSRTALAVITIQLLIFAYYLYFYFGYKRLILNTVKFISIIGMVFLTVFGTKFYNAISEKVSSLNLVSNLETNISNKTRLGIQYTSLITFTENPLTGVGFGQQAFDGKNRYPRWATKNNYEFDLFYLNEKNPSFPPGYNIYTRILSELGIIGFLIFIYFEVKILKSTRKIIRKETDLYGRVLGCTLSISFIGIFINWLQIDTFRIYGIWMSLAILIIYLKYYEQNNSTNTSLQ